MKTYCQVYYSSYSQTITEVAVVDGQKKIFKFPFTPVIYERCEYDSGFKDLNGINVEPKEVKSIYDYYSRRRCYKEKYDKYNLFKLLTKRVLIKMRRR